MATTNTTHTPDHYIADATYELLLQAILHPVPSLDPRSQLIETLGEIGGVWPQFIQMENAA